MRAITRDNFAAVPTRTSDAPVWVQAHKIQYLRWRDCIMKMRRVQGVVFAMLLATTMEIGVNCQFLADFNNNKLPYFKKLSASSKLKKVQIAYVLANALSVRPQPMSRSAPWGDSLDNIYLRPLKNC